MLGGKDGRKALEGPPTSQSAPRDPYLSQRELLSYLQEEQEVISRIIHRKMEKPPNTPQREGDKLRSNRRR